MNKIKKIFFVLFCIVFSINLYAPPQPQPEEEEICAICQAPMKAKEEWLETLPCGH